MKLISNNILKSFPFIATGIAYLLVACGQVLAAPRIVVDEPLWNFGSVTNFGAAANHGDLAHDFFIRNTGDAPLVINQVFSSCNACLRAEMEQMIIPPGGSNVLHSHLDLRLLTGNVFRTILIDCNDSQRPAVILELSGLIIPAYQMLPPEIRLDLSQGQKTGTMGISPLLPLHSGLSQVSCDDTNIAAEIAPVFSDKFLLSVRLKTLPPRGDHVANLTVRSSDSNDPPCHLTVRVHHPGDLEWIPDRLVFQPQAPPQERVLLLRQYGTNRLTLLDAIAPPKKFHCEIEPLPFGNYRIYVNAVGLESLAGQTNVLVLKLKNSANEKIDAPVPMAVEAP